MILLPTESGIFYLVKLHWSTTWQRLDDLNQVEWKQQNSRDNFFPWLSVMTETKEDHCYPLPTQSACA